MLAGMALWGYGYLIPGTPPLLDWKAIAPWWIAGFLPNIESEIGLVLVCVAMIPIYGPSPAQYGKDDVDMRAVQVRHGRTLKALGLKSAEHRTMSIGDDDHKRFWRSPLLRFGLAMIVVLVMFGVWLASVFG